jgi:hypothetical protein
MTPRTNIREAEQVDAAFEATQRGGELRAVVLATVYVVVGGHVAGFAIMHLGYFFGGL